MINKASPNQIFLELIQKDYSSLSDSFLDESFLKQLANLVLVNNVESEIIFNLMKYLSDNNYTKFYDWNFGSIIQHFNPSKVIDFLKKTQTLFYLYDSIGLTWVLGEFKIKDPLVVQFLYEVVEKSKNSEAWWRAAFSLEKLGFVEAVTILKRSLKKRGLKSLDFYLDNLSDKRSIIGVLLNCSNDNLEKIIYPKLKAVFLAAQENSCLINCTWLIGRLGLMDNAIYLRAISLINTGDYELKYYILFSIQNNSSESFGKVLESCINSEDPLIRKMSIRRLSQMRDSLSLEKLNTLLINEKNESVISEITRAIYILNNPEMKRELILQRRSEENENGLIVDETDKWYGDPWIYDVFSQAEDPEDLCFKLIIDHIRKENIKILNPVDLACGTGRISKQLIERVDYEGTLYAVDVNTLMCNYLLKELKRDKSYVREISVLNSSIIDLPSNLPEKSSLILSSFGFPSKITDKNRCIAELKAVYNCLTDKGIFVTLGWDETFNDELNQMWFKHIPDGICADNFEEWRIKRLSAITSPRNCKLTWLKKGLIVPLQFSSLEDSAYIMGRLFGRDSVMEIIKNKKTSWEMSLGITYNTKAQLLNIIEEFEK